MLFCSNVYDLLHSRFPLPIRILFHISQGSQFEPIFSDLHHVFESLSFFFYGKQEKKNNPPEHNMILINNILGKTQIFKWNWTHCKEPSVPWGVIWSYLGVGAMRNWPCPFFWVSALIRMEHRPAQLGTNSLLPLYVEYHVWMVPCLGLIFFSHTTINSGRINT